MAPTSTGEGHPAARNHLLDGQQVPLYGDGGTPAAGSTSKTMPGIQLGWSGHGQTHHINGDAELTNLELTVKRRALRRGIAHGHARN